jgi:hypothetical protein
MTEKLASDKVAELASRAAAGGTDNQRAYAEWLLKESGYVCKTKGEREAFIAAAMMYGAYKLFQASKPTSSQYVPAAKPVRKSRGAK